MSIAHNYLILIFFSLFLTLWLLLSSSLHHMFLHCWCPSHLLSTLFLFCTYFLTYPSYPIPPTCTYLSPSPSSLSPAFHSKPLISNLPFKTAILGICRINCLIPKWMVEMWGAQYCIRWDPIRMRSAKAALTEEGLVWSVLYVCMIWCGIIG